jgi:hypothetical protein
VPPKPCLIGETEKNWTEGRREAKKENMKGGPVIEIKALPEAIKGHYRAFLEGIQDKDLHGAQNAALRVLSHYDQVGAEVPGEFERAYARLLALEKENGG